MEINIYKNKQAWLSYQSCSELFKLKIMPQESCEITIKYSLNILDIQGFWSPEMRLPSNKILWTIQASAVGQRNFPYLSFFNSTNLNRGSFSLLGTFDDCKFEATMNQEKCTYDINITIAASGKEFEFMMDFRDVNWLDCLKKWRELSEEYYPLRNFPAAAWDPVYCTWYAVHAAVTQQWVETTAKLAIALGFKTLIIDDGWCFDVMKRHSPATASSWYEMIGDWEVSILKFPDFVEHVKRIKKLGMSYMLWVAPFLIGIRSQIQSKMEGHLLDDCKESNYIFDTEFAAGREIIIEKLSNLMKNYPIDGLKVDFLDYIFPDLETPRGVNCMKFIDKLSQEIRKVKEDALIEYRQNYATMQMLPNATQFRAMDVPFDFVDNFHRLCHIRISLGDKVPIHADPMYWHPNEKIENIARHMIASLVGVPMLSMELSTLSSEAKEVIITHMNLYKKYQKTLNLGEWKIRFTTTNVAYAVADLEDESVIFINDIKYLDESLIDRKDKKSLLIFNLSGYEVDFPWQNYMPHGGEANSSKLVVGGHCIK